MNIPFPIGTLVQASPSPFSFGEALGIIIGWNIDKHRARILFPNSGYKGPVLMIPREFKVVLCFHTISFLRKANLAEEDIQIISEMRAEKKCPACPASHDIQDEYQIRTRISKLDMNIALEQALDNMHRKRIL